MMYAVIALILILLILFCYYQNNHLVVDNYYLESNSIKNELKIVQLSDLHSKIPKNLAKTVKKQNPSIITVTGDYINDKCKNMSKMLEYEKELSKIAPVFYIPGNHERRLSNFNELMNDISKNGFNVLVNDFKTVYINENEITFLGLSENQADKKDYKARRKGKFKYESHKNELELFEKMNGFKILLCHFPENFEMLKEINYSQYDFDIQLSGHAHGGQFNLPFVGPCYSPGQGVFPKYSKGEFGNKPKLIVSRGIGNAEFPIRLFNYPEIVVITVNKECK